MNTNTHKLRKSVLGGAVTAAALAGALLGSSAATAIEQDAPSSEQEFGVQALTNNGYWIYNTSGADLILNPDSIKQDSGNGFGKALPDRVRAGEQKYFEVANQTLVADDTSFTYRSTAGDTVTFHANAKRESWDWTNNYRPVTDNSSCKSALGITDNGTRTTGYRCDTAGATRVGEQTIFRYLFVDAPGGMQ